MKQNICEYCGDTFWGKKKARGCPKCRRQRANARSKSFLKNHPDYSRRKMNEYRMRKSQGIILQPQKSAALHLAHLIASANKQGWSVEMTHREGKWKWSAAKGEVKLVSDQEFESFAEARKDFLEAVF